jgi:hypothetical protein
MSESVTRDDMPPCYLEVFDNCEQVFQDLIECSEKKVPDQCRMEQHMVAHCFARTLCPKQYEIAAESELEEDTIKLHECWQKKWLDCFQSVQSYNPHKQ